MDEKRPDPGQLLRKLQYEEEEKQKKAKGKLKIFLGYAAGSGKTYAMLEAAHEAKKHQVDVVAGYIEPHARPDTQAMIEGLEVTPPLVEFSFASLTWMRHCKENPNYSWWMSWRIQTYMEVEMKSDIRMYRSFFELVSMYIQR